MGKNGELWFLRMARHGKTWQDMARHGKTWQDVKIRHDCKTFQMLLIFRYLAVPALLLATDLVLPLPVSVQHFCKRKQEGDDSSSGNTWVYLYNLIQYITVHYSTIYAIMFDVHQDTIANAVDGSKCATRVHSCSDMFWLIIYCTSLFICR